MARGCASRLLPIAWFWKPARGASRSSMSGRPRIQSIFWLPTFQRRAFCSRQIILHCPNQARFRQRLPRRARSPRRLRGTSCESRRFSPRTARGLERWTTYERRLKPRSSRHVSKVRRHGHREVAVHVARRPSKLALLQLPDSIDDCLRVLRSCNSSSSPAAARSSCSLSAWARRRLAPRVLIGLLSTPSSRDSSATSAAASRSPLVIQTRRFIWLPIGASFLQMMSKSSLSLMRSKRSMMSSFSRLSPAAAAARQRSPLQEFRWWSCCFPFRPLFAVRRRSCRQR